MAKGMPSWNSCFHGDDMGAESIIIKLKIVTSNQNSRPMALPLFTGKVYHNGDNN